MRQAHRGITFSVKDVQQSYAQRPRASEGRVRHLMIASDCDSVKVKATTDVGDYTSNICRPIDRR